MFINYKLNKLREKCRLLAVDWVINLTEATQDDAKRYIDNCLYFDNNLWFDLKRSEFQNTDYAILRSLNYKIDLEIEVISAGESLHVNLQPGVLGVHSQENFNDLRITFTLAAVYTSYFISDSPQNVPDGIFSSMNMNTEVNALSFIDAFIKWKSLPIISMNGHEMPLETLMTAV